MAVMRWSELRRNPRAVAKLAERENVHLRHRDGSEYLLTRTERVEPAAAALSAARAVRDILNRLPAADRVEALSEEFPWLRRMHEDARAEFATQFGLTFRACADQGEWSALDQLLTESKHAARSPAAGVGHPKGTE